MLRLRVYENWAIARDTYFFRLPGITYNDTYSVMQSGGNSFCGDVGSDSFNKKSRDEDHNLDQILQRKCVRIIVMMVYILYNIIQKCILTIQ